MAENSENSINNPVTYGAFHEWRAHGGTNRVSVSNCLKAEDAYDSIASSLRDDGWKLPRWWHFWRWNENIPNWLKERFQNDPTQ